MPESNCMSVFFPSSFSPVEGPEGPRDVAESASRAKLEALKFTYYSQGVSFCFRTPGRRK